MASPHVPAEIPAAERPRARADAADSPARPTSSANGKAKSGIERELGKVEGRKWVRRLAVAGVVVVLAGGLVGWRIATRPKPPPRYVTAEITHGPVTETVQSTGAVQPVIQVQVGAQVSGRITQVYVDFNSEVKEGDLIAEIDPMLFDQAIEGNQAQLSQAHAAVSRAESNLATEKVRLARVKKLVQEGLGSQSDLDTEQGAFNVAMADRAAAIAAVGTIQAQLKSSRTNLDYTHIYSPIAGTVITRSIDPGQTVAASFQAPTLFVIAQDLRKMRVLADIDEADVGKLGAGMHADVSVDAFPGEKFEGEVSQVRYSPTTQSGVVTYAAVIDVDNPDVKLRPGMTATVAIRSAEVKDAQRIANAALRFKPSPPTDKDGKKLPVEPLPALGPNKGRLYVLTDATIGAEKTEMREVDTGITDGIHTVLKTDLGGLKIVLDETDEASGPNKRGPRLF